jgi:hypothetical protein
VASSPCRYTALHWASQNGKTETAMALVEAGADVRCKNNEGYGSRGCILVPLNRHSAGRTVGPLGCGAAGVAGSAVQQYGAALCVAQRPHGDGDGAGQGGRGRALQGERRVRFSGCIVGSSTRLELQERLVRLCSNTALHLALRYGHTVTAMALVKAGADVRCKDKYGYGSRAASSCRWGVTVRGRTVRPLGGGAAGVAVWAVQEDGAARCVAERPHGDCGGAGRGGRGRALQGQLRVRISGCILVWLPCSQCGVDGVSVHSGWSGGSACLAAKVDGAALVVVERQH